MLNLPSESKLIPQAVKQPEQKAICFQASAIAEDWLLQQGFCSQQKELLKKLPALPICWALPQHLLDRQQLVDSLSWSSLGCLLDFCYLSTPKNRWSLRKTIEIAARQHLLCRHLLLLFLPCNVNWKIMAFLMPREAPGSKILARLIRHGSIMQCTVSFLQPWMFAHWADFSCEHMQSFHHTTAWQFSQTGKIFGRLRCCQGTGLVQQSCAALDDLY